MKNFEWFMGIDVSKGKLDITLLKSHEKVKYEVIENEIKSIECFIKSLATIASFDWSKCLVCMEHTGVYNAHLLVVAQKYNWNLCLESAVQIKQSGGLQRGKNDQVDSERIAQYAYKNVSFLKLWQPTRASLTMLQKLSGLRHRLIQAKKQLSNTLKEDKAFLDKSVTKIVSGCTKQSIAGIEKDLEQVEQQLKKIIAEDDTLKKMFAIIESVPGVGMVTAIQLVVTTNEFKNINDPRKYACYSGIAPFEHSSGRSIRGRTRTSKKANQHVKSLLHMCSLVAIQHCPELKQYYQRKVNEGKNKMAVLNAVKNKLIHRIFACITQNRPYEKNFTNSFVLS